MDFAAPMAPAALPRRRGRAELWLWALGPGPLRLALCAAQARVRALHGTGALVGPAADLELRVQILGRALGPLETYPRSVGPSWVRRLYRVEVASLYAQWEQQQEAQYRDLGADQLREELMASPGAMLDFYRAREARVLLAFCGRPALELTDREVIQYMALRAEGEKLAADPPGTRYFVKRKREGKR